MIHFGASLSGGSDFFFCGNGRKVGKGQRDRGTARQRDKDNALPFMPLGTRA